MLHHVDELPPWSSAASESPRGGLVPNIDAPSDGSDHTPATTEVVQALSASRGAHRSRPGRFRVPKGRDGYRAEGVSSRSRTGRPLNGGGDILMPPSTGSPG
jgi:hypothetical protein